MAIAFDDVQFPETIARGALGGPGFLSERFDLPGGNAAILQRSDLPLHQYDVSFGVKSWEELVAIRLFFLARRGSAHAFRFRDWHDSTSTDVGLGTDVLGPAVSDDDQPMVALPGSTTQFQLVKDYTSAGRTLRRPIYLPRTSTIVVADDGTPLASGWSVNSAGVVTFDSAPTAPTWGGEFDVCVRFGPDTDKLLGMRADDFNAGSIPNITLIEERGDARVPSLYLYGGSMELAISADYTISVSDGVLQIVAPTTTGLTVSLPDPTHLPGGRALTLVAEDNAYAVKDHNGTTLKASLTAGTALDCFVHIDGGGDPVWYVVG